MNLNIKTKIMNRIILLISILFLTLTGCQNSENREFHKLKNDKGYCYQDDDFIWHLYVLNELTGQYDYSTTSNPPSYDNTATTDFTPSSDSVSNFSDSPQASEMSESTGTDEGGSNDANDSDGSGMSEDSGSDTGGSDSGSSDSGGSDGGGGDGGGGE